MARETEYGFVGCLGPDEEGAGDSEDVSCTPVGEGWMLRLKSAGASSYKWNNGFVLVTGQGVEIAESNGKALSAEAIALNYQATGESVASAFDGSFAVVLWDATRQKLLLWRDDSGARLLYYFQGPDNTFWFATSLQLLMRYLGKRPISMLGLSEYLRFLDISPPYTIFEDVVFLPPEKLAWVECGRSMDQLGQMKHVGNVENADKPPPPTLTYEKFSTFDEVVTVFDGLLKSSIAKHVESMPRVCSFLSGGVDSSLVSAVAASIRGDVRAVTVGFEDARLDESPVARKITEHIGIEHEVMCFSQEEDLRAFESFTSTVGSPFADPAIIPTFQCFEKTGENCDLVLDGTGADTLIGMMPARHLRFIMNYSAHLPDSTRRLIARTLGMTGPTRRYKDLFDFEDPVELMIRWKGWTSSEISDLCGQPCDLSHTMFYRIYREGFSEKSPYELYSLLMGNLPDDRIHQSRELFGPEVSFPFFDSAIQSFVRSLPFQYRYAPDEPKKLFRHLLGRYIPESIWNVPKHGFDYPFENLMQYRDNYLINTYLSLESLDQHGLFDAKIVSQYIQSFLSGDTSLRFKIWALLVFQAWYDNSYRQLGGGMKL